MDIELRTTRGEIEDFKNSILWKDIKAELGKWLKMCRIEQDGIVQDAEENNPSTATVLLHIGDINGRKKAINFILEMPDMFLSILDYKLEDKLNDS